MADIIELDSIRKARHEGDEGREATAIRPIQSKSATVTKLASGKIDKTPQPA